MRHSRFAWLFSVSSLLVGVPACGEDESKEPNGSGGSRSSSGGTTTGGTTGNASGGTTGNASGGTTGNASGGTNAEGGTGGSGETNPELDELCEKTCNDQASLACAFSDEDCPLSCSGIAEYLEFPDEYLAMMRCQAEDLGPADYVCLSMDPDPVTWPAPTADTSCEPAICEWYCSESTLWGNSAVYNRCEC